MAQSDKHESTRPGDGGFQGFERILPENCVEYMLFIIEADLQPKQVLSALESVRKAAVQLANRLTKDYIWQRDGFSLETRTDKGLLYLGGITDYGDSVEDEWLIVYMLRELTRQFPSLWVRVTDSDGEFLLVEAANVLPKWLSPENDANRAWINQGMLRIIPLDADARSAKSITLPQAVHALQLSPDALVHSTFVEAEAFYRLEKYPGQIQESLHYAKVTVPRRLAHVLHELPKAISPAVEAFYLRDPISLKPLMSGSADQLVFPPKDLVCVSVKFTRVLYAQLKSQPLSPPPAWQVVFSSSDKDSGSGEAAKKHSMLELGMKVACGFEMLAVGAAKSNNRTAREVALLLDDLAEDGDSSLPKNVDISAWKDSDRDDDDSWMDVDFADFERELDGKRGAKGTTALSDANAQADLRKIVARFEAFLNDDKAGLDGAELDEMDEDDEDDDSSDESDSEDRDVSFDEDEFSRMMREMMGIPAGATPSSSKGKEKASERQATPMEEDSEDEEIRQLSEQMAAELNEHGALDLDPTPKKLKALKGKGKQKAEGSGKDASLDEQDEGESEDEEVDIDYNLAKNLLESFKGQAGLVGPVGTMLADMGMRLPRDDSDEDQDDE